MKLLLGGAQLGSSYGINNEGKYSFNESTKLLEKILLNNDIYGIDTARAYGLSEQVIGLTLKKNKNLKDIRVFSKLNPFAENNSRKKSIFSFAKKSIQDSFFQLKTSKIYSLSFHHFRDWKKENIDIKKLLVKLKSEEKIEKIGISISNPDELLEVIKSDYIDMVQIPYNFLDHRWDKCIILNAESPNPKEIYARSIFLQGMIFSDLKTLKKVTNVTDPKKFTEKIDNIKKALKINNLEELAIRYVRSNENINGIVLGVDNEDQFNKNLLFFKKDKLSLEELDYVNKHRPFLGAKTLNPAKWNE